MLLGEIWGGVLKPCHMPVSHLKKVCAVVLWGVGLWLMARTNGPRKHCDALFEQGCFSNHAAWYCSSGQVIDWVQALSARQVYAEGIKIQQEGRYHKVTWRYCVYDD